MSKKMGRCMRICMVGLSFLTLAGGAPAHSTSFFQWLKELFSPASQSIRDIRFARKASEATDDRLPDPTLTFKEFEGKPLVVVLWRVGCAPCLQELALMNRLEPELGKEGVVVLPILTDTQWGRVVAFLTHMSRHSKKGHTQTWQDIFPNLPPYYDAGSQVVEHFGVKVVPTVIFFNKKHQETHRHTGVMSWKSPEGMQELRKHLGLPSKSPEGPSSKPVQSSPRV